MVTNAGFVLISAFRATWQVLLLYRGSYSWGAGGSMLVRRLKLNPNGDQSSSLFKLYLATNEVRV